MSAWVTEKMAGHCGARLSGVSLSNATHSDLEQMRSALFEHHYTLLMKTQHCVHFQSKD